MFGNLDNCTKNCWEIQKTNSLECSILYICLVYKIKIDIGLYRLGKQVMWNLE